MHSYLCHDTTLLILEMHLLAVFFVPLLFYLANLSLYEYTFCITPSFVEYYISSDNSLDNMDHHNLISHFYFDKLLLMNRTITTHNNIPMHFPRRSYPLPNIDSEMIVDQLPESIHFFLLDPAALIQKILKIIIHSLSVSLST